MSKNQQLSESQLDRARGAIAGLAVGDALGVPYEFGQRLPAGKRPEMTGGGLGPYEPYEWSDDTQMASVILQAAAGCGDLTTGDALNSIAAGFVNWRTQGASDIGAQTRAVITRCLRDPVFTGSPAVVMMSHAAAHHHKTGRSGGNGSLMRTAPVALAHLSDRSGLVEAAHSVSRLTHYDPLAGDLCAVWSLWIREAVFTGDWNISAAEDAFHQPADGQATARLVNEALFADPLNFTPNGYVATAFQAAVASVSHALDACRSGRPTEFFTTAVETAVHIGNDTDTIAAITGSLAGAMVGASAIPLEWREGVHGWTPASSKARGSWLEIQAAGVASRSFKR